MRPTQEYIRRVLHYDPWAGSWTWRERVANRVHIGDPAGSVGDKGYLVISVQSRDYKAHQLAWLYMTGEWPDQVDHRNGDRGDCRWKNLRLATYADNAKNAKRRKDNTSGVKGVCARPNGRWQANISVNCRRIHLGTFHSIEGATAAYAEAARRYHGDFARTE